MNALTRRVNTLAKQTAAQYEALQYGLVRLWRTRPYTHSYDERLALDSVLDFYAARIQGDDVPLTPDARALIERFQADDVISDHVAKLEALAPGWKDFLYGPLKETEPVRAPDA